MKNTNMLALGVAATTVVGFAYAMYNRKAEAKRTQEAKEAALKVINPEGVLVAKQVSALVKGHFTAKRADVATKKMKVSFKKG